MSLNAQIDLIQSRIGRHLELQQVDSDEGCMSKLDLNSNPFLEEVHLRRGEPWLVEDRRLTPPSPGDKTLLEYLIEAGTGKGGDLDARICKHFLYLLLEGQLAV